MFRKTRIRLVALNALIFFLVLCSLGVILYTYMDRSVYFSIDDRLEDTGHKAERENFREMSHDHERESERKVIYVLWDENGHLVKGVPQSEFTHSDLLKFDPVHHKADSKWNVALNGQTYRIMKIDVGGITIPKISDVPIKTVGLVINIGTEINLLKHLLFFIIIGSFVGLLVSIIAGLFLANRSLIPIQASWNKQSQFVADASHELRTPLSVIQTHLELLFRHPEHTIEEESVAIYKSLQEVKRINKLVEDLLTLARTDSDQRLIQSNPFLLNELIKTVADQFEPIAHMKEVVIGLKLDGAVQVEGDKERFHQLLVILIDNALKYTKPGGKVDILCGKEKNKILLVIKDNGIGIAEEDLPNIFDRFYRSDKSRTRADGGTGLGLSIAKWIVEAHKGTIEAASQLQKGTEIRIKFPAS